MLIEEKLNDTNHHNVKLSKKEPNSTIFSTLLDNNEFTQTELTVVSELKKVFSYMPDLVEDLDYLMYFRSNESPSVFLSRKLNNYKLVDAFFNERCLIHHTCSKFASTHSLSDKILISPIYRDAFTNKNIITVSTPIYHNGHLIGDIAMDIYLSKYVFFNDKSLIRSEKGINVVTSIKEPSYPLHDFAYTEEYAADNRNIFIYNVPLTKLILNSIWIFISLFSGCSLLLWKLNELKLKNARLEDVELVVNRDELTGLYNRSILTESGLLTRIKKSGAAVIAIDGDKLKTINDTYGHHIGDEAIRHIAFGMNLTFRESDYLIRTGGDEFLVILLGCNQESAEKLASTLQKNINNQPFSINTVSVRISVGITVMTEAESLNSVIKRADSLLYANKRTNK